MLHCNIQHMRHRQQSKRTPCKQAPW
jgi:hypothetical protein